RMPVRDTVEKGNDDVEPGLEHFVELAEPLHDPGALLRHHAHALDHEHHHQRDDGERDPKRVDRRVSVDEDRGDEDGDYFEKQAASHGARDFVPRPRTIRRAASWRSEESTREL